MKRKTREKGNGTERVNISATVLREKRRQLEQIAKSENRNLSQVVGIAIDEYLLRSAS